MATAQGVRFKENDTGNLRLSAEDIPVAGTQVPFEELLARELRKSEANARVKEEAAPTGGRCGGARKKPFLKKGARGWWMERPDAKKKLPKHTLTSKDMDEETKHVTPVRRRPQQRKHQKAPSPTPTMSPPPSPPAMPPQTLSPPVSPIRRLGRSDADAGNNGSRRQRTDGQTAWENMSLRSTSSNDLMGMNRVRQSYEAKQEREADEMAEFEAIERELAAEKDAYITERRHQPEPPTVSYLEQFQRLGNSSREDRWGLPSSTPASDLHQEQRSTAGHGDNLDADAHSSLVFDDRSSISHDDWRPNRLASIDHSTLSDQFSIEKHFGYAPSDLSAISFDDSESWNDGLSFQQRRSGSIGSVDAGTRLATSTAAYESFDRPPGLSMTGQQTFDHDDYAGVDNEDVPRRQRLHEESDPNQGADEEAPVSSLVQHVFGETGLDKSSDGDGLSYSNDGNSFISVDDERDRAESVSNGQSGSLSMLKQKLQERPRAATAKERPAATRTQSRRGRGGKTKGVAPPRPTARDKTGGATANSKLPPRGVAGSMSGSGPILPAVIEEKLYELEEEVKFYKSETLQLQKRKEYYDQEVKKLAKERDEFAQYQQEQRLLIEREWEKERAKMKKEQKLLERQVKLRMNAAMSQQERKDRGEVETLKAQIVKMQLDEKARVGKWKAGSDNLRQRVAELEEKNRELSDEIKFLEKDRLEQWGKYERLLKEKQEAPVTPARDTLPSSMGVSKDPGFSVNDGLHTMDDIFTVKGTAEELLQSWNYRHDEDRHDDLDDEGRASNSSSGFHRGAPATIADGYNPKRYNLEREDREPRGEEFNFHPDGGLVGDNTVHDSGGDGFHDRSNSDAGFKWAFPDSNHDIILDGQLDSDGSRKPEAEADARGGAISASTSSLSDSKLVNQEIAHPGGKREFLYSDSSKKIVFADGNEKEIDATGHVVIKFTNGDHKELFPDTGISVYYYHEAQTKLTTYPDGRKVYEFPNEQVETSLPDGTTEIQFADGIKKTIRPNGDEFSVFPDGTTMLEQTDGLREVTLLNQKQIRYFPDGQMACVTAGGQETRVRSDAELKRLMESS